MRSYWILVGPVTKAGLQESHWIISKECLLQTKHTQANWLVEDWGHSPQVQLKMVPLSSSEPEERQMAKTKCEPAPPTPHLSPPLTLPSLS